MVALDHMQVTSVGVCLTHSLQPGGELGVIAEGWVSILAATLCRAIGI